jgi:hypothetical protein
VRRDNIVARSIPGAESWLTAAGDRIAGNADACGRQLRLRARFGAVLLKSIVSGGIGIS